jgi:acetoin utilization deacetylase AcuC-like enzyme
VFIPEKNCSEMNKTHGSFKVLEKSNLFYILAVIQPFMPHRLFYIDRYVLPLPEGHKFPRQKYGMLRALLAQEPRFQFHPAPQASQKTIEIAHDPLYVKQFLKSELPASAMRRIGFPWSEQLVQRSLASVGGTLSAATEALATGFGATLGGGTHHALRAEGAGFCVFNDIAVAIESLRAEGRIRRAAVVDLDVHQGDGTAEIFSHESEVFTVSIHCRSNFPFRKQQSRLDLHLPDRTGDDAYLRHVDEVLPEVEAFQPEIMFYQSGVDALEADALGHLSMSHEGLRQRDLKVMRFAREHGIPLVLTLGGGYAKPIELSVQAHLSTYLCAAEVFGV